MPPPTQISVLVELHPRVPDNLSEDSATWCRAKPGIDSQGRNICTFQHYQHGERERGAHLQNLKLCHILCALPLPSARQANNMISSFTSSLHFTSWA